jgi:hypothetical protein
MWWHSNCGRIEISVKWFDGSRLEKKLIITGLFFPRPAAGLHLKYYAIDIFSINCLRQVEQRSRINQYFWKAL